MTVERRAQEQALDRVILELREQPGPELDWHRIEARLMLEPKPELGPQLFTGLRRLRLPAAALVAATLLSLLIFAHRSPKSSAPVSPKLARQTINGDRAVLGTHFTAGKQQVVVEHLGRARWTLEPHASASIAELGEFLTIRLDSGALSAEVVPSTKAETFAVEVGGTRVAVHGTAFRVERNNDRVLVSVSEGTVAVEAVGSRLAPAFLLRRDSRGSFALDGHTGSVEGNASAVVQDSGAQSHRQIARILPITARPSAGRPSPKKVAALPAPSASASPRADEASPSVVPEPSGPSPTLPLQPSIADIETGVSSLIELMNRCFHEKTAATGIHVSVNSGLTLNVTGEGAVQSVTFAPPLAPSVEDCAVMGLRELRFARSAEGVTFTRLLELNL